MGFPSEDAISDSPTTSTAVIQPVCGEGIPGEVNIEWYKTALDAIQPDRFQGVRLLHEKCRHDESPMLVAQDTSTAARPHVMLQVFTTQEEFARARDCAVRCCNCRIPAGLASSPRSPKYAASPRSPIGASSITGSLDDDSVLCHIHEVHGNAALQQWCVVLERSLCTKGGDTLDMRLRRAALSKGEVRRVFIHVARGVQELHRAGLVHNAICPSNIIDVKRGTKLGNFAALQRQGEARRSGGPGHHLCSPEKSLARQLHQPLHVDFATDVWSLGLLLHELLCGKSWPQQRTESEIDEELLASEPVALPALDSAEDGSEDALAKNLVARMLIKHPAQRPVVDVVVSEAIATLFPSCELNPPQKTPPKPHVSDSRRLDSPPAKRPSASSSNSPHGSPNGEDESLTTDATGNRSGIKAVENQTPSEDEGRPSCACRCLVM